MAPKGKRKAPATNRGFATTSLPSKSKEQSAQATSADVSKTATPKVEESGASITEAQRSKQDAKANDPHVKDLHELSPEELEQRLEDADAQRIVEKYGSKVARDSSRAVNELETDCRIKSAQAQGLQCQYSLPQRSLSRILQLAKEDVEAGRYHFEQESPTKVVALQGDGLVSRLWPLQKTLTALRFPSTQVDSAIKHLIRHPPAAGTDAQNWGIEQSIDWIALNTAEQNLPVFDVHSGKAIDFEAEQKLKDNQASDDDALSDASASKTTNGGLRSQDDEASLSSPEDDFEVSDVEDGLEPEELQSIYLATKSKLYETQPDLFETNGRRGSKKKGGKQQPAPGTARPGVRKLQQKLEKIESDILFNKDDADLQWENQRVLISREQAERRKLQVIDRAASTKSSDEGAKMSSARRRGSRSENGSAMSAPGDASTSDEDDDQALVDLFSAVAADGPGETPQQITDNTSTVTNVSIRDFGQPKGIEPRRVLEDACKARDPSAKLSYKLVSSTAFSNRHRLDIYWSKSQGSEDPLDYYPVQSTLYSRHYHFTMNHVATPDQMQSLSYVSVFALFQMSIVNGRREDKAYLRLPTAWKDFYAELQGAYTRQLENVQKEEVRNIKTIVESKQRVESDDDVVLTRNFKSRNQDKTGVKQIRSDNQVDLETQSDVAAIWQRKSASPAYQQMLHTRKSLPMWTFKDEVLATIERNQVTIIRGETGCGKSTQTPAFILEHELSHGRPCKVYCTEPRRISAITLAQRVSQELAEARRDLGSERSLIGFAIRLESQVANSTRLVYATTGIVLRMLESEQGFTGVTHIVVDEVHERSIETDFLLILLKKLRYNRPRLKIILMSATVDAVKFSKYFDDAPVLNVPGRTFPVERRFLEDAIELTGFAGEAEDQDQGKDEDSASDSEVGKEPANKESYLAQYSSATRTALANWKEYRINYSLVSKLISTIIEHQDYRSYSQAILVFLPGIAEIRSMHGLLSGLKTAAHYQIHMLHSTMSSEDQQAAFVLPPAGMGKIVLSTNIAETGVTIPDVTCVIDTGTHKEMRFDERRQISRLIESFISRANAKQRCGRAGRVQKGLCFHLFTKERHDTKMTEAQSPEMLRLSLQDLIMRVKICKLGDIQGTLEDALDRPSVKNISRAIGALQDVNALTQHEELTALGRQLSKLPLDPYLGKLVLYGSIFSCLDVTLTLAAILSSKSPFVSPVGARSQADAARAAFKKDDSDLLTEYNAYCAWRRSCTESRVSEAQFCRRNCLSSQTLCNIEDIKAQMLTVLNDEVKLVSLTPVERSEFSRISNTGAPGRKRRFVSVPSNLSTQDSNPGLVSAVIAWSFYPKLLIRHGRGWKNAGTNQDIHLHPTSILRLSPPANFDRIKYLSFYSILQSSGARNLNANSVTPASPMMLALGVGSASWYPTAFVIGIDGKMRLAIDMPAPKRKKQSASSEKPGERGETERQQEIEGVIGPWKTFVALKFLRRRLEEAVQRKWKKPAEPLPRFLERWSNAFMEMMEESAKA